MPTPKSGVPKERVGTCFACGRAIYSGDLAVFDTPSRQYKFHEGCLAQQRREIEGWNKDVRTSNESIRK